MTMNDIHDIKPPITPVFDPVILYYGISAILIIALIGTAFLLWKHRKRKRLFQTTPPLAPHEAAFQMLNELTTVLPHLTGKEFYFNLSAILRCYIEKRYQINAQEMTTEEFLPQMDRLEIPQNLKQGVKTLCRSSDPIKFANIPAVESQMLADLTFVREFVQQTIPAVPAESESEDKRQMS